MTATDCGVEHGGPDFAERTLLGWHLLFALMVAATFAVLAADGHAALAALVLGLLIVAYVGLALPSARRKSVGLAAAYLTLAYLCLLVLEWNDPAALVLLFALYPQGFVLLPRTSAIVATVILTLAFSVVLVALDGWTGSSWAWHGLAAIGNIAFALIIGLFIDGLIRESRRNRELLADLRATQGELARAEREAGAVAERESIARDIHDTLAQGFTSIVVLAQAGEDAATSGDDASAVRRFVEIQETARDNLAEARALVGAMSPPALASGGLVGALGRLAERHTAQTGVAVRFEVLGEVRGLAQSSEVVALRATQESLANARKHSGATALGVVLAYDEDGATVTVSDDGIGFEVEEARTGFGLDGIASRVESVGGLTQIDSAPGSGTRVRVRVP